MIASLIASAKITDIIGIRIIGITNSTQVIPSTKEISVHGGNGGTLRQNEWMVTFMPDQPQKPTIDDIVRELGHDRMAFFSDMVRPDQEDEREEDANLPLSPTATREVKLTPEHERAIIEDLEKHFGRKLTPEEIHLALEQARSI